MHSDKLIRPADTDIDSALLASAKRSIMAADPESFKAVLDQLTGLLDIALKHDNKALIARYKSLSDQIGRAVRHPGRTLIMETKSASALKRAPSFDEDLADIADSDPLGSIEGYGATFDNLDFGGDVIVPGAFAKSLSRWRVEGYLPIMLAQHNSGAFPVGSWTSLVEDSRGLRVKGVLANTARGREAWTLIHMRPAALTGLSIGYSTIKSSMRDDGARLLQELELFEVSLVGSPMNSLARLDLGKSRPADELSASLRRLSTIAAGNVVDFPRSDVSSALADLSRRISRLTRR